MPEPPCRCTSQRWVTPTRWPATEGRPNRYCRNYRRGRTQPCLAFWLCAGLGDRLRTLEWLENAYQRRVLYLFYLAVNPQFDAFRAEPRFRDLVRRIGLTAGS